jgi:heat-inducible transcriptional repressor
MVNLSPIGKREQEILTAIVETYISTGEPVGSRTLARTSSEGLSAATIRNVMADLADGGYLEQPHTSAGRVPSVDGYRYYVERLSGQVKLAHEESQNIDDVFHGTTDVQDFMERTSHVLSLITQGVGVAIASGGKRNALEHVHFQRLADQKILAVLVTTGGLVRDRVLRVAHDLSQNDLDLSARYINENFRGWTVNDIEREIAKRLDLERNEYDRLSRSIQELHRSGALSPDGNPDLYVEGTANLIARETDKQRLQQLLKALEEKERIVELLTAYLDTRQEAVRVVIGLDDAMPDLSNFVLIGAPARAGDEVLGRLAVIGTTRMDYQHTMSAVSYITRLFDKLLNESE